MDLICNKKLDYHPILVIIVNPGGSGYAYDDERVIRMARTDEKSKYIGHASLVTDEKYEKVQMFIKIDDNVKRTPKPGYDELCDVETCFSSLP